jgi:acyl transferase domain-containing protein
VTETEDKKSGLRRALADLSEMQAEVEKLKRIEREPIAIVGIGCRFPGASGPGELWRLLKEGRDATSEVPPDRWDRAKHHDDDPDAPGKTYVSRGGYLSDVDGFDASFFRIFPREAASTDPQHRILLEVTWEALENAGLVPDRLRESKTGVFIGLSSSDFALNLPGFKDHRLLDATVAGGTAANFAAGRISYWFGFHGPSFVVDSACSSSLVSVHLACQSLRNKESDLAIAGGVNLILSPAAHIALSKARMLSRDGRCKTFDASADGYGRGEGCGLVVLKRLSDVRPTDRVFSVILSSAVNQDGPSSGITVPNALAQQALLRTVLDRAKIEPNVVSYIEAHGTGTALGDPIEMRSLAAVYCRNRSKDRSLIVGSLKTNLGHLEAAAGIAGLIKAALSVHHREIPPHLHFESPSPHIAWDDIAVTVPSKTTPWPSWAERRIAGVSSFGISGTNAHVLLEAPPDRPLEAGSPEAELICLSAKTSAGLDAAVSRLRDHISAESELSLPDLAYTLQLGRPHFEHRFALVVRTKEELKAALSREIRREPYSTAPKVAFLYTGQGSQIAGMGRALFERQPVFKIALEECDELLRPELERPLLSVLFGEGSRIDETGYTQPVLFAFQFALTALWRSWGVVPSVVMGHSLGEYSAACAAGVFSLSEGLALVSERSRLMQSLPPGGAMAAVFASEAVAREAIEGYGDQVSIAAKNSPGETVISGAEKAIEEITAKLESGGVRSRRLTVSHAFHSPLMGPILDRFDAAAERYNYKPSQVPVISNLTGAHVERFTGRHWREHLAAPVDFEGGMKSLAAQGATAFLEIGPSATLIAMGRRCLEDDFAWASSLRSGEEDLEAMKRAVAALFSHGVEIDLERVEAGRKRRVCSLPSYAFQHTKFERQPAIELPPSTEPSGALRLTAHPIPSSLNHRLFEGLLRPEVSPILRDHKVFDRPVVTGAVHLALVQRALGEKELRGEEISFSRPLVLEEGESRQIQLVLSDSPGGFKFELYSREAQSAELVLHTSGKIRNGVAGELEPEPGSDRRGRCSEEITGEAFYETHWPKGIHEIGPSLRLVETVWRRDGEALARIRVPEGEDREIAISEASGQVLKAALPAEKRSTVHVVARIRKTSLSEIDPSSGMWCHVLLDSAGAGFVGDLTLFDDRGMFVGKTEGMELHPIKKEPFLRSLRRGPVEKKKAPIEVDALKRMAPSVRTIALEVVLKAELGSILGLGPEELPSDRPLRDLGIDSLVTVELKSAIESELEIELSMADLIEGPSLATLAQIVSSKLSPDQPRVESSEERSWFAYLEPITKPRIRLFCFPYGGGGASIFRGWQSHLPAGIEVRPIQLPGREQRIREQALDQLEPLVASLTEVIGPYLDLPFALFGHSMGALIAFELARALDRKFGKAPAAFFAAGYPAPHLENRFFENLLPEDPEDLEGIEKRKDRIRELDLLPDALIGDQDLMRVLLPTFCADFTLVKSYKYFEAPPLSCPLFAYSGEDDPEITVPHVSEWYRHTTGTFTLRVLPGAHRFVDTQRGALLQCLSTDLGG